MHYIDPNTLALPTDRAAAAVGVPRSRIEAAIKNKELTARSAGKRIIIEVDELRRWEGAQQEANLSFLPDALTVKQALELMIDQYEQLCADHGVMGWPGLVQRAKGALESK